MKHDITHPDNPLCIVKLFQIVYKQKQNSLRMMKQEKKKIKGSREDFLEKSKITICPGLYDCLPF